MSSVWEHENLNTSLLRQHLFSCSGEAKETTYLVRSDMYSCSHALFCRLILLPVHSSILPHTSDFFYRELHIVAQFSHSLFWKNLFTSDKRSSNCLRRFRKIAKATIGFVMSVRPFVRMEQLGSHWRDFYEIFYFSISRKSVENSQV
jgi:hypothetical protein